MDHRRLKKIKYTDPPGFEPGIAGLEGQRFIHAKPRARRVLFLSFALSVLQHVIYGYNDIEMLEEERGTLFSQAALTLPLGLFFWARPLSSQIYLSCRRLFRPRRWSPMPLPNPFP